MNVTFAWDPDGDAGGNVKRIRRKRLTKGDVEHAVENGVLDPDVSNMAGWPTLFGPAEDGRTIAVTFRWDDERTIYVIDAAVGG